MIKALVLDKENNATTATIKSLDESALPQADTRIAVHYSSINYKDGLAITGKGKVVRNFPMVPGIDFSGEVIESQSSRWKTGDKVILTGWGVGENHWGGLAEQASVNSEWLVALPKQLSAEQSMAIGTAGLTAMLCVQALVEGGITPEQGEVLVTGASGGVGSVAVTLLAQLGYSVTALTGRRDTNGSLLNTLGASNIIERSELDTPAKPLDRQRWAGVIDTVGSNVLASAISQTHYNGIVAACGLAGGFDLPSSVMPFILRNVRLQGIDSVMCATEKRERAWQQLAELLPANFYTTATQTIDLDSVPDCAAKIIKGQVTGRTLVKL